jgi:hypothetical protein
MAKLRRTRKFCIFFSASTKERPSPDCTKSASTGSMEIRNFFHSSEKAIPNTGSSLLGSPCEA